MLKVVFENENFVAVDKPAGWLSVPGRQGRPEQKPGAAARSAPPCLVDEVRLRFSGAMTVHRLDEPVTGVVLFALNAGAHRAACLWFEHHTITKFYEAWTEGRSPDESERQALWTSRLVRGKKRAFEAPHGKPSRTRASWLGERRRAGGGVAQLWSIEPLTGRSHQIRFELSKHGYPVVGDALYGAKDRWRESEIALRAVKLVFPLGDEASGAAALKLPPSLEVGGLRDG